MLTGFESGIVSLLESIPDTTFLSTFMLESSSTTQRNRPHSSLYYNNSSNTPSSHWDASDYIQHCKSTHANQLHASIAVCMAIDSRRVHGST